MSITAGAPARHRSERSKRLGGPAHYGSYAVAKRIGKLDQLVSLQGMRVLDLGCGNGCYTVELARRAAWLCGLDIEPGRLRAFREPLPRVQAAGENLPFSCDSFDVITMIEVLEHTASDVQVLKECHRVLRPGGLLIVFLPNKWYPMESHPCHLGRMAIGHNVPFVSWLPETLHARLCHARIYSRRGLVSLVRAAGFTVKHLSYIFPPVDSFPLPFKTMYRGLAWRLEDSRLGVFGVSLFAVLEKSRGVAEFDAKHTAGRKIATC